MKSLVDLSQIIVVLVAAVLLATSNAMPAPDSAGMVEMVNGLAYGMYTHALKSPARILYNI